MLRSDLLNLVHLRSAGVVSLGTVNCLKLLGAKYHMCLRLLQNRYENKTINILSHINELFYLYRKIKWPYNYGFSIVSDPHECMLRFCFAQRVRLLRVSAERRASRAERSVDRHTYLSLRLMFLQNTCMFDLCVFMRRVCLALTHWLRASHSPCIAWLMVSRSTNICMYNA